MNIIGRRRIWYIISLILIVPGIVALIYWQIPTGIDFKGGTLIDIQYDQSVPKEQVQKALDDANIKGNITSSGNDFLIKTAPLDQEAQKNLQGTLSKVGEYKQNRLETVGPTVSGKIGITTFIYGLVAPIRVLGVNFPPNTNIQNAISAVIWASIAIIIYIAIAFRRVPKPASSWKFGVSAVVALLHDLLFVAGAFAILGHFFGYEVDSLFITALLTIMGFSVHDTIVVFDRIRENLRKSPSLSFEENVNNSILQTLNRSLNTSFTVLIVLLALYLLGGETLKHFMLALLLGIAIGTYSSIFNASPLLVSWHTWSARRVARASGNISS